MFLSTQYETLWDPWGMWEAPRPLTFPVSHFKGAQFQQSSGADMNQLIMHTTTKAY